MVEIVKPTTLNKIWGATNLVSPPSDSKIDTGWTVEIPTWEDFQWLDNRQDQFIAYLNQHGVPEWDNITEYRINKSYILGSDGIIYRCLVTNTNKNPVTDSQRTVYWAVAFDLAGTAYDKSTTDGKYLQKQSNLLDVSNQTLARINLGLGSASTLNTGTSVGQVMLVGSFGIGDTSSAPGIPGNDLNSIVANGFYASFGATNAPTNGSYSIIHQNQSASYALQIAMWEGDGTLYTRSKTFGVWTSWRKSFDSSNVTVFIQYLFGASDSSVARSVLGLGSAATKDSGTTTGALMPVGSFGLGTSSATILTTNADSLTQTGFYYLSSFSTNIPFGEFGTLIHQQSDASGYATQIWQSVTSQQRIFSRRKSNNVWGQWLEIYNSGNTVPVVNGGTGAVDAATARSNLGINNATPTSAGLTKVAQSFGDALADGTAAISNNALNNIYNLSSNHNPNGYQGLPGGFIKQWGTVSGDFSDSQTSITFPTSFTQVRNVICTVIRNSATGDANAQISAYVGNVTNSNFVLYGANAGIGAAGYYWEASGY